MDKRLEALWRDFVDAHFVIEWSDRDPVTAYEVDRGEIVIYLWPVITALAIGDVIYLLLCGKKVRLAIRGGSAKKKTGRVIEAKNLETGSTHEPGEFVQERKRAKSSRLRRTSFRRLFG